MQTSADVFPRRAGAPNKKDAVDREAAAHVSDRHVVGIDHADQLGARGRLAEHAQSIAGPKLDCSAAGTVLPSEPSTCTSTELELQRDVGSTSKSVKL